MPNGHGGIPRFGSPCIAALATVLLIWWARSSHHIAPKVLALLTAGVAGWRLAYHFTMWGVTEYSGAAATPEERKTARRNYLLASLVLVPAASLFVYFLIP